MFEFTNFRATSVPLATEQWAVKHWREPSLKSRESPYIPGRPGLIARRRGPRGDRRRDVLSPARAARSWAGVVVRIPSGPPSAVSWARDVPAPGLAPHDSTSIT